jgi:hypothetical protein
MAVSKKCANPSCSCTVEKGKYCSLFCEDSKVVTEFTCHCDHQVCRGEAL